MTGYTGPFPPPGQTHRYFFRIYGLDILLDLPGGSTRDQLVRAMQGHIVQYGETFVTYGAVPASRRTAGLRDQREDVSLHESGAGSQAGARARQVLGNPVPD